MTVVLGAGALLLLAGLFSGVPGSFRGRLPLAAVAAGGVLIVVAGVVLIAARAGSCDPGAPRAECAWTEGRAR